MSIFAFGTYKVTSVDQNHISALKLALENGALMSTLSGSGSTFFNLAYKDDAYSIYNVLRDNFKDFTIKILQFDNVGVKVYN